MPGQRSLDGPGVRAHAEVRLDRPGRGFGADMIARTSALLVDYVLTITVSIAFTVIMIAGLAISLLRGAKSP